MELFQKSLQDALASNVAEGQRWEAYKIDHLQAQENLKKFSQHLEVDIMVPLGSKALVSGQLYNTGVVFVSHYQNLFSKCSAYQAGNICEKRLQLAHERLDALTSEYKRYADKLQMPFTENAFKIVGEDEIIEEYDDEKEKIWREQHRENVKRQKRLEAEERQLNKSKADQDVLDLLDELELIEEMNEELATHKPPAALDLDRTELNTDDDFTDTSDDDIPRSFRRLTKQTKDMQPDDQLTFFESHLDELQAFLQQSKPNTFEELNEKTDKIVLFDHIKQKCDSLRAAIRSEKRRKQIAELNVGIDEKKAVMVVATEDVVAPEKSLKKRVSFDNLDQVKVFSNDEKCNEVPTNEVPTVVGESLTFQLKITHSSYRLADEWTEPIDFENGIIRHPADIAEWATSLKSNKLPVLKSILKSKRNSVTKSMDSNDSESPVDDCGTKLNANPHYQEFNKVMDSVFGEVFQRPPETAETKTDIVDGKPMMQQEKKKVSLFKQSRRK